MDFDAAVGTIVAVVVVFFVPLLFSVIGAYRESHWASHPPPPPIFRKSSRKTLSLIAYLALTVAALLIGPPHLFFVGLLLFAAGQAWAWMAPPEATTAEDVTPPR